jgi:ubiquinone/menaquinone biosynthesis C-methylase UbiE
MLILACKKICHNDTSPMKKWKQKALVQKTISYLPYSKEINFIFQKHVTKGVHLTDEYFYDRLGHARDHLRSYQRCTARPVHQSSLEIGTGWYPIVPVGFFLAGAEKIYSVDIHFLTSKERVLNTLHKFIECFNSKQLINYLDYLPEKIAIVKEIIKDYDNLSLDSMLGKLNIIYLIEDARKLSLPDNSIDLINSNNTFEHIYPEILIPILKDFKRVVKKDHGIMSHFIDMSDHFAHFDKSITIYNFLQFTDRQWKWIDNSIQPQSRLRIYDYHRIFCDLEIPVTSKLCREGEPEALKSIRLAEKYLQHPPEETAISHCHIVSEIKNMG